jgi:ATP-binding cassette subfamily B multidrug efflux pump
LSSVAQTLEQPKAREPRLSTVRNLRGLLPYLRRYRGKLVAGCFFLVTGNIVGAILPLVVGVIVDSLSGSRSMLERFTDLPAYLHNLLVSFYRPFSRETLFFYGTVLVVVVALKGLFSFWTRWILIGVSRDIEYDLRNDLLERLTTLEPGFYVRNRTGELMSRCTNDLNAVRMVLGPGIMYSANTIVIMVAALALMLKLSPLLTLLVFLPVPVVAFAVRYFGQIIHERYEKIQATLAALSARVQENLAGVRVVRAYSQEEPETRSFEKLNREFVERNLLLIRAWSMFYPALEGLIGSTFLIVLWQGGRLVLQQQISLGTLIAFFFYMSQLVWPMIALGWVTNIFQRGAASMGRMEYILSAHPAINDAEAELPADAEVRGGLELRNLTFAYPTAGNGQEPPVVLRDINLTIPAGSTCAIVGPTGCGKSTLAGLVARLSDAPPDSLLLDGHPLRHWPLQTLRRAIGFVPQDTFLFSDTVRENIAFGVEQAPQEHIEEAAKIANIYAEIEEFPKKFDTLVGERGITLSGGQKQRTALARALVRDPRILILDDALSSVDTETEERILRRLKDVMRQRTTLLISHRCSTVRHADQIVVLRDGRVVERGTHDELLQLGGYYADLYQKQLLEEELERA